MPKARILVVEDETIIAEDLRQSLIHLGYDVTDVAQSAEGAIQAILKTRPDLVLMDIVLAGKMDGIEAARQIRSQNHLPVIYLTAYTDEATFQRAKITEPYGYLRKPFEIRDLDMAIEMALYKNEMEKRLRESEQWLSTTLRSIGDGVIAADREGTITFMNPVAETLTGWTREEARGRALDEVFRVLHEGTREKTENPVLKVLREDSVIGLTNHTLLISKTGTEIPIGDSSAPIRDAQGNMTGVVLVFRDVTEKQQVEKEREATIGLLQLINSADDLHGLIKAMLFFLKKWSGCTSVGMRLSEGGDFPYFETTGFPEEFVIAENRLCLSTPEGETLTDEAGNPVLECMCGNILRGRFDPSKPFFTERGSFWTNSTTVLLADTTEADRQARTRNRCNGEGYESVALIPLHFKGSTFGLLQFNDKRRGRFDENKILLLERLADNVAIAIEQQMARSELLKSEERFRSLYDEAPICYREIDQESRIVNINRTGLEMLGYDRDEMIGQPVWKFVKDENAREQVLARLAGTLPPAKNTVRIFIRKDGALIPVLIEDRLVFDEGGRIRGMRSTMQDISPLRKAQDENARLEAQLRQAQKMEAIGTLAGGIAHDFNNILAAIIGYTEMALLAKSPDGPDLKECLEQVIKAGYRATDLVKQILAFSRKSDREKRGLKITPILKEALKLLKASLPATIAIRQEISTKAGMVFGNAVEIHQVIVNLCTNAAHAMGEKGGMLRVRLADETLSSDDISNHPGLKPGPYLRFSVTDTGCGIAPEIIDQIFEPYFTTKEPGEGTGMGLAVVHGIVKSHEGEIQVESRPGEGAAFHILLPSYEGTAQEKEGPPRADLEARGDERILLVDDEDALVQVGKELLEHLGYRVTVETRYQEAIDIFRSRPGEFDLVITDQTMPGITGGELAKKLMEIRPDIPIILVSGFSPMMSQEKARALGIREFLMKPLKMGGLAAAIRRVLDEKKN
jgi:PAS domain S-box-containing protein